ncbi:hypothetical protein BN7874_213 [Phage NCTB]|jgi:hypothetical protein|nr:hypothetical protein BN7874_213 [Phage NCTB]
MLISLSAAINVKQYAWYKFLGKRSAKYLSHNRHYDLELESGDVFGLKPQRNGQFYLVESQALDVRFKLTEKEALTLIKRCKQFSGKVGGKSVKDSLRGAPGGMDSDNSLDKSKGAGSVRVEVSAFKHPHEDQELTRKLKSLRIPGLKKVEFIQAREMLPGEVYYFYDGISSLRSYRRKHGLPVGQYGNWARDTEKAIEKALPGVDVEIGTVKMHGELRHLIVVVDV